MPVSFLPLLLPVVFVGLIGFGLVRGRKTLLRCCVVIVSLFAAVTLPTYVEGWLLMFRARSGNPAIIYKLAKWREMHAERIGRFILWPEEPDVLGGYACLERAAQQDYPPALYALGVRLKYGDHVPMPPNWNGPAGNVFPQPERGQPYIDKALLLGFRPLVNEEYFYWQVYRELVLRDPAG